ncbi:head-tail connector protein [Chachezhania sediminis]|uniref:hypothetical protein n=1 Tax=Chachezhania sediminis TaxID=2599291 RepID=UPI00131B5C7D|nr:hypothetical protein [Chachezhania sediminis]
MRYIGESETPALVSVADFKSAGHIGADDVVDDAPMESLLAVAQAVVCDATGIPPAAGLYEFTWPVMGREWRRWWFPCRPVTGIVEVAVNDATGAFVAQSLDGMQLVQGYDEPQLLLPANWSGFGDDVHTIRIQATVGSDAPPPQLGQAITLIAREWHNAGILIEGEGPAPRLGFTGKRLIKQVRYARPRVAAPC